MPKANRGLAHLNKGWFFKSIDDNLLWHGPNCFGGSTSYHSPGANYLQAGAIYIPKTFYCSQLAIVIDTWNGGYYRYGLYEDNGSLYPGKLIIDSGQSYGSYWVFKTTLNQYLIGGRTYWAAYVQSDNSRIGGMGCNHPDILGWYNVNYWSNGWRASFTYAALPDPFPGGATVLKSEVGVFMR